MVLGLFINPSKSKIKLSLIIDHIIKQNGNNTCNNRHEACDSMDLQI